MTPSCHWVVTCHGRILNLELYLAHSRWVLQPTQSATHSHAQLVSHSHSQGESACVCVCVCVRVSLTNSVGHSHCVWLVTQSATGSLRVSHCLRIDEWRDWLSHWQWVSDTDWVTSDWLTHCHSTGLSEYWSEWLRLRVSQSQWLTEWITEWASSTGVKLYHLWLDVCGQSARVSCKPEPILSPGSVVINPSWFLM